MANGVGGRKLSLGRKLLVGSGELEWDRLMKGQIKMLMKGVFEMLRLSLQNLYEMC